MTIMLQFPHNIVLMFQSFFMPDIIEGISTRLFSMSQLLDSFLSRYMLSARTHARKISHSHQQQHAIIISSKCIFFCVHCLEFNTNDANTLELFILLSLFIRFILQNLYIYLLDMDTPLCLRAIFTNVMATS